MLLLLLIPHYRSPSKVSHWVASYPTHWTVARMAVCTSAKHQGHRWAECGAEPLGARSCSTAKRGRSSWRWSCSSKSKCLCSVLLQPPEKDEEEDVWWCFWEDVRMLNKWWPLLRRWNFVLCGFRETRGECEWLLMAQRTTAMRFSSYKNVSLHFRLSKDQSGYNFDFRLLYKVLPRETAVVRFGGIRRTGKLHFKLSNSLFFYYLIDSFKLSHQNSFHG